MAASFVVCAAALSQSSGLPGWRLAGNDRTEFAIGIDESVRHGGARSANIRCVPSKCNGFGTLIQIIRAENYLGRRIRLSAWVKADRAGQANIWMRVDGSDATIAFDNMDNRKARGTFEWRLQQIVLDVPADAAIINYGMLVAHGGQAWLDDVLLEAVDKRVKSTDMLQHAVRAGSMSMAEMERLSTAPVNGDFEQAPGN